VCDGLASSARIFGIPAGDDVYVLLVAVGPNGEGPYGTMSAGLDRHDPGIDPRPPSAFCP
jgi:hypothetical protein